VVTVKNNMDEALDVFAPESNNKSFSVELKTNTPGKEYQLVISTVPPMDSGTVQGQISMKTSATNSPTINVTAWANVQQAITVSPPNISLPAGPLPAQQTMTVNIQNNAANPVTISEPTVNDQRVEVKLEEPVAGRTFRALLTFPQGFEMAQG